MSTVREKVPNQISGLEFSDAEVKRRNPHAKNVYKPRLSTKIKWALEDSMERAMRAERRMRNVLAWLEETHKFDIDDRGRAHLGKLEVELFALALEVSEIGRIAAAAIAESKEAK